MYVIGNCDWSFIQIKFDLLMSQKEFFREIREVIYNIDQSEISILNNLDDAKALLEEIKNHAGEIKITNDSIIDSILDGHNLDVTTLKIYELVPTVVLTENA